VPPRRSSRLTKQLRFGSPSPISSARSRSISPPGIVYELGPHRLLCGDSTNPEAVTTALGGTMADILWTDAPYGVAYQSHMAEGGTASRFRAIENDDLEPEALRAFLTVCFTNAAAGMRPGGAIYACHANRRPGIAAAFEAALLAAGFHMAGVLVWVKPAATMGLARLPEPLRADPLRVEEGRRSPQGGGQDRDDGVGGSPRFCGGL